MSEHRFITEDDLRAAAIRSVKSSWEDFREAHADDDWYMKGGCYEFALGLGSALEWFGFPVKYLEWGSDEEPMVHVAIEVRGHAIDFNTFGTRDEVIANADIYTNTVCEWHDVFKTSIPEKDYDAVKKEFMWLLGGDGMENVLRENISNKLAKLYARRADLMARDRVYYWQTIDYNWHGGPITDIDSNDIFVACEFHGKECGTTCNDDLLLEELYKTGLQEDVGGVGLSGNFSAMAPENALSMNGVPLEHSRKSPKGNGDWDHAYAELKRLGEELKCLLADLKM